MYELIAADSGIPESVVKHVMGSFQDVVVRTLVQGESVCMTNFVSFYPVHRVAGVRRNLQTGETFVVPAHESVRVKVLPRVKELVRADSLEENGKLITVRKRAKGALSANKDTEGNVS